jgi:hypothetical protein
MKDKTLKEQRVCERRVFERVANKISLKFLNPQSKKYGFVETRDVSPRGVGIQADNELPPRTPVEMWLTTPKGGKTYYTKGEVVWSKMVESKKFRIGINLEKLDLKGMSPFLKPR